MSNMHPIQKHRNGKQYLLLLKQLRHEPATEREECKPDHICDCHDFFYIVFGHVIVSFIIQAGVIVAVIVW